MGAGEQAGPQAAGAQQRLGHPGGRGLAIGPGDVDDGIGPVRVAEQADQRRDPVQRRLDRMLGAPGQDLALDLAQPVTAVSGHDGMQVGAITLAVYCPGRCGPPGRPAVPADPGTAPASPAAAPADLAVPPADLAPDLAVPPAD